MADGMNRSSPLGHGAARFAMLAAFQALACAHCAIAADIADPTRPPSGFSEKATEAPREAPMRVDGLFLMGKKPYAIVDGRTVRVGDRLDAGRIGKIDESGVWLKTPTGPRQLKLLPDVEKTPVGKGKKKVEKR